MTASEYEAMYRAVPTRHGLAAVGQAFLLEANDRARTLEGREALEVVGAAMTAKWRDFAARCAGMALPPESGAMDGLTAMVLNRKGYR